MKKIIFLLIIASTSILLPGFKSLPADKEPKKLYHVLLFKWKTDVDKQQIETIGNLWLGLKEKIDGFDSYELNALESGGFDHVVILTFASQCAYESYQNHADHQKIKELGPQMIENFSEFAYWKQQN